uniref:Peroxidasin-like protein n=1 Tax=Magallana gigas TaxID=29159 RepID=K1QGI2_MAGGI
MNCFRVINYLIHDLKKWIHDPPVQIGVAGPTINMYQSRGLGVMTGLFFLFVASSAYSNFNIELVLNTNIEHSLNPERFSQRQGYGPHLPNKHWYSSVVSGKPSPHFRRRSRLPEPDQEVLLKIPATFNCRCYNDDPVQGRIHYQSRRRWLQSKNRRREAEEVEEEEDDDEDCEFARRLSCDYTSKFRTINGSCNNLAHPYWGMAETPLIRFLCSVYEDGMGAPRSRGKFRPLPEPREIRLKVHDKSRPRHELKRFTHYLMFFGQMLSHDLQENVKSETPDGEDLDCCGIHRSDPNCIMRLRIRGNDPFYGPFGVRCLNFSRSEASPDLNCNFKVRQTITEYTMYIDGSSFYGSNEKDYPDLRTFIGGLLTTQDHPHGEGELMPPTDEPEDGCRETTFKCFHSGDGRVNQQAPLIAQHTLWLREHNRLARKLAELYPNWDDERLFQEARKIVGAMFQHITYTEYLPLILGDDIMDQFQLRPLPKGSFFEGYDACVNPTIRQGFFAAAFRFGHSMINDFVGFQPASGDYHRDRLRDIFNIPDHLYQREGIEQTIRGLYLERSQSVDRLKSEEVLNHLFEIGPGTGSDLISININRGRDHAIPPYMSYRKMCNLYTTNKFSGLVDHTQDVRELLAETYDHVNDIDLFTGAVSETPLDGALVGPTLACIIGLQFKALKIGDRFYYENNEPYAGFRLSQIDQIKNTTLAQVICRNMNIGKIQKNVFIHGLPEVDCADIQNDIDLTHWADPTP